MLGYSLEIILSLSKTSRRWQLPPSIVVPTDFIPVLPSPVLPTIRGSRYLQWKRKKKHLRNKQFKSRETSLQSRTLRSRSTSDNFFFIKGGKKAGTKFRHSSSRKKEKELSLLFSFKAKWHAWKKKGVEEVRALLLAWLYQQPSHVVMASVRFFIS